MKLKPAEGRAVRDPAKRTLLPADGAEVTLDAFWRRRLRDGDVVEVTAVADVTTPAKSTAKASSATGDAGTAATTEATS
ncbi:DUF2635 domain-containing protein [Pantoea brenneri]|uniref:DUF2635 domain-containing protein n=1 Tax=Pantoea brenneri TaxID=472694 RepID=UPI00244B312A|nr:DUF2635 domain-containing protein [Pantoea brenneri]MDH1088840.1 DUF2635 domain-containing protein [Pantoea brenneri]